VSGPRALFGQNPMLDANKNKREQAVELAAFFPRLQVNERILFGWPISSAALTYPQPRRESCIYALIVVLAFTCHIAAQE